MKSKEKNIVIILATLLFIILMSCFFGLKTDARENNVLRDSVKTEAEFKKEIINLLKNEGMNNPGITLAKETADGVNISYEVVIYVPAYKHFTETDRENLLAKLYEIELDVNNSQVVFSLT